MSQLESGNIPDPIKLADGGRLVFDNISEKNTKPTNTLEFWPPDGGPSSMIYYWQKQDEVKGWSLSIKDTPDGPVDEQYISGILDRMEFSSTADKEIVEEHLGILGQ